MGESMALALRERFRESGQRTILDRRGAESTLTTFPRTTINCRTGGRYSSLRFPWAWDRQQHILYIMNADERMKKVPNAEMTIMAQRGKLMSRNTRDEAASSDELLTAAGYADGISWAGEACLVVAASRVDERVWWRRCGCAGLDMESHEHVGYRRIRNEDQHAHVKGKSRE